MLHTNFTHKEAGFFKLNAENFSEDMSEMRLREQASKITNETLAPDFYHRLKLLATRPANYQTLADKFGVILIRENGSYMTLGEDTEIINTQYNSHFPIDNFADIVVCENAEKAEIYWLEYLKKRFPDKTISIINFFDLKSEIEISKHFKEAEYITFSTTFSDYNWFEKMTKLSGSKPTIGHCKDFYKWEKALEINPSVEVVKDL